MNLKQEFLEALQAGRDYQALIEIVRRYLDQGISAECAYEVLQQIWLDLIGRRWSARPPVTVMSDSTT